MNWVKKSKKLYKKLNFWILPFAFLILLIIVVVVLFSHNLSDSKKNIFNPERIINIQEPFSGDLYFNDELGGNILSSLVIDAINSAKKSVEIAVYSMDDERIRDSIYDAVKRKVKVSIVFSNKNMERHDKLFVDMPEGILRKDITSRDENGYSEYMHHKFMIIDRGEDSQKLFFGSYNFTIIQDKYDPSFIFETDRPEIVEIYANEFDRIFSGLYGRKKISSYNPFAALIKYPEGFIEVWFGPQGKNNGIKDRMLNLIKDSKKEIKSMIWLMTDMDIAKALILTSDNKKVEILTDDSNIFMENSVFAYMLNQKKYKKLNNMYIIDDARRNEELKNNFNEYKLNSFLHHHLLIIDNEVIVFGTNNWSTGGFFRNDESIIISNIPSLVSSYNDSFEFNYNKNK
ncbi:MAG: phospholipase D-like domain-containing protein [Patescibacteria group bacterium]|nr:phospholipase D-like domain-containing protein [Patescibacteria group bacterium]MDD4304530.1 phospholipase D-like domain-containing protein [Patescibacteria group bacterium]MDD4695638.1 phospholipase D-like domain-containing protein [Patescibacteria group bacterium]